MTALPTARRRFAVGVLAVCAALALSACAAGKKAPTSEESPAIDAVGASVGKMLLREVSVAAPVNGPSLPSGGNAELKLVIVNNGTQDDELTSVTSTAAGSVQLLGSAAAGSLVPSSSASSSDSSSTGSSESPTATGSSSAGSSSSAPGSAGGTAFTPVTVPAGQRVAFGIGDAGQVLALTGLTNALYPATLVPVTFTFQNAGSVTVQVPVELTSGPVSGVVISDTVSSSPEDSEFAGH